MNLFSIRTLLLLVTAFGVVACNRTTALPTVFSAESSTNCRIITHQIGDTEICGQPQRVVVLGPYLLEQVLALGAQPIGYGDHIAFHQGDYDNPKQQIPYLGSRITTQPVNVGLAYQPSIETILKARPDLILATASGETQYEVLANIAPTLSFEVTGGKTNLEQIGEALGLSDRAEAIKTETETLVEEAKKQFAPVVQTHPKILILTSDNAQEFNVMSHTNSLCGSLVYELGFQPIYPKGFDESKVDHSDVISLEVLPQMNTADSIVLLSYSWDTSSLSDMNEFEQHQNKALKEAWEKNAIAQSLDASKARRVYFIPAYLCLGLPGPIGTELYLDELKTQLLPAPAP